MWLNVAVPVPLYQTFTYCSEHPVLPGTRVSVPFGHRTLLGVVMGEAPPPTHTDNIKTIIDVIDEQPLLSEALLKYAQRIAHYYHHPIGEVVALMLPVWLRNGHPLPCCDLRYWQLTEAGTEALLASVKKTEKQRRLLQTLAAGAMDEALLVSDKPILKQLQKKAWAACNTRSPIPFAWQRQLRIEGQLVPNQQQAIAISAINHVADTFATFLLEGVTGSGKTEVYLQCIAQCLQRAMQVLVLVPEIGLTPQMVERFEQRFGLSVAVLHSKISDKQRADIWHSAKQGVAAIVIGTRSAVFTPFKRLGLIIIDEEHDDSFKQQDGLRYHARDLALMRGQLDVCPVVLGTATPSLETLHNALQGKYHHLSLSKRAGNARMPRMEILDIRHQPLHSGLSESLIVQIRNELAHGHQVLVFVNRRGYAPAVICHACGHTTDCRACEVPYTYHLASGRLHCHSCGSSKPLPSVCGHCGSTELLMEGVGSEQVESGLKSLFADVTQVRIDSDSVRSKSALTERLAAINAGHFQLLVGTQILSKGHHFANVTLVAIVDCDGALFSADFRAPERLGQLITQLAGRAGRQSTPGRMLLQTHNPEHPLLQDLVHNGYAHFARQALQERKRAGLPPYSYQIAIRAEAADKALAYQFLQQCRKHCSLGHAGLTFIGPIPALQEKRQGRFRFLLLLQSPQRPALHKTAAHLVTAIPSFEHRAKIRWSVDVDPQDFY